LSLSVEAIFGITNQNGTTPGTYRRSDKGDSMQYFSIGGSKYHVRALLFALCFLLLSALLSQPANAQSAAVSGLVIDQSGASVPNVQITFTNESTGVAQSCQTNREGLYSLPFVKPGKYTLSANSPGFKRFIKQAITVETAQNLAIDVRLQVGRVNETITVDGSGIEVDTVDAAVKTMVDRQFVATLPLNGRSFSALYLLVPGVQPTTGSGAGTEGQYAVNGQRPTSNQYQIDGVSANYGVFQTATLASTAAGSLPATSSTGGTNGLLSEDALQEFQVQTSSYAPEYGRTAGAQVEVTSRSGTNAFHGTAFDYLRNEAFDANDWFNNFNNIPRQPHRQNDFGGVLGGPILRDRTFFFVSYEGLRLTQPQTLQGSVPSLATRAAAPANMQILLNMFPLPNQAVQGTTGLAGFVKAYATKYNVDAFSTRIDHRVSNNLLIFGRYNHAPSNASSQGSRNSMSSSSPLSTSS
jgi:hypothetical protein